MYYHNTDDIALSMFMSFLGKFLPFLYRIVRVKGCKGDLDDDDILTISSERRPYVRVETKIEFIKTQKGVHFCKFSVPTLLL